MNKKYIKINQDKKIIDVFFEHQKNKFDGSEILFEEVETIKHKINGKSISNESGTFIFYYAGGVAHERTAVEISNDPQEKAYQISKLQAELSNTDIEIPRSVEDLMDVLDASNVLKKNKMPKEFIDKVNDKKTKRAELLALINS